MGGSWHCRALAGALTEGGDGPGAATGRSLLRLRTATLVAPRTVRRSLEDEPDLGAGLHAVGVGLRLVVLAGCGVAVAVQADLDSRRGGEGLAHHGIGRAEDDLRREGRGGDAFGGGRGPGHDARGPRGGEEKAAGAGP